MTPQKNLFDLVFKSSLFASFAPGDTGDAGRADGERGACPGDGVEPLAAHHTDGVQHAVSPHPVESPHHSRPAQRQR